MERDRCTNWGRAGKARREEATWRALGMAMPPRIRMDVWRAAHEQDLRIH